MQKFEARLASVKLSRRYKKTDQFSEQTLHRNEEEKHTLEIIAREALDQEIAEIFSKRRMRDNKARAEMNCQTEDERWDYNKARDLEIAGRFSN